MKQTDVDTLKAAIQGRWPYEKDLAASMGMNPRHLASIKASERRNRYYNELGATKLACLWVIEHFKKE